MLAEGCPFLTAEIPMSMFLQTAEPLRNEVTRQRSVGINGTTGAGHALVFIRIADTIVPTSYVMSQDVSC